METSLNLLDNNFITENWTERVYNFSHIPCDTKGKCSSTQTKTGGPNKTPFRQTYHQWSAVDNLKTHIVTLHLSEQFKINLNATGKLNKISYSFQAMSLVGNIIFGFVVLQNDVLYITKTNFIKKSFQWNLVEKLNLTQEDFQSGDGTKPNFSKGILEFGYMTMCSTDSGTSECISGVGSWNIKLSFEESPLQRLKKFESEKLDVNSLKKENKILENKLKVEETKFFEANFKLEKLTKNFQQTHDDLAREKLKSEQLQISFELLTKQLASRNKEVKKLHQDILGLQQKIDEIDEMNIMKIEIENETCKHPEHVIDLKRDVKKKIENVVPLESILPNIEKINLEDLIKEEDENLEYEENDGYINIQTDQDVIMKELEIETKKLMEEKQKEKKIQSNYTRKVIGVEKKEDQNEDWELM